MRPNSERKTTRNIAGVEVPDAQSFDVCFCGHCPSAHVVFYNVKNEMICHATFSAGQARRLVEKIHKHDPNFRCE
jgi:hypothetical protein